MYDYGYYDGYGGYGTYGYGWNSGNIVRGTNDPCGACEGGKIGCGWTTYHNNELLGSCKRPVTFTRLERRCVCDEEIDILVPDREFFDRLRFDCTACREFFGSICTCIEFGDTRPVFISDGPKCERLLPLESRRNGFIIHADQIQPFADHGCMRLMKMTACFDPHNDHVTIANYFRKHSKCDCRKDCGCCDGRFGGEGEIINEVY